MTPKLEEDRAKEGRLLLDKVPALYRRHLALSLLREVGRAKNNSDKMESSLCEKIFDTPIGRRIDKKLGTSYGWNKLHRESMMKRLIEIALDLDLVSAQETYVPRIFNLTDNGSLKLKLRDQFVSSFIADSSRSKGRKTEIYV